MNIWFYFSLYHLGITTHLALRKITLTRAKSKSEAKIKVVQARNHTSMNLMYPTWDTSELGSLFKVMKVSQLAVPRVVLPGIADGSSQKDTQLMQTSMEEGM